MKNKISVEEQVAALTEEQKNTVLKVDKYGTILLLNLTLPGLLILCVGFFFMVTESKLFNMDMYNGLQIVGGIVVLISGCMFAFIKIKFPYYSDKKASYIRKSRKNK